MSKNDDFHKLHQVPRLKPAPHEPPPELSAERKADLAAEQLQRQRMNDKTQRMLEGLRRNHKVTE